MTLARKYQISLEDTPFYQFKSDNTTSSEATGLDYLPVAILVVVLVLFLSFAIYLEQRLSISKPGLCGYLPKSQTCREMKKLQRKNSESQKMQQLLVKLQSDRAEQIVWLV